MLYGLVRFQVHQSGFFGIIQAAVCQKQLWNCVYACSNSFGVWIIEGWLSRWRNGSPLSNLKSSKISSLGRVSPFRFWCSGCSLAALVFVRSIRVIMVLITPSEQMYGLGEVTFVRTVIGHGYTNEWINVIQSNTWVSSGLEVVKGLLLNWTYRIDNEFSWTIRSKPCGMPHLPILS